MPSEDERIAEMVGAGDKFTVIEHRTEKGRRGKIKHEDVEVTYTLSPCRARQLSELIREAVHFYKREYMETFRSNVDLLGGDSQSILRDELRTLASKGIDEIPHKIGYAVNWVTPTAELREFIESKFGYSAETDSGLLLLTNYALDNGVITPEEVKEHSGKYPVSGRIRYDNWWVTGCTEGMIAFIHASISQRHPEVTREHILNTWDQFKIVEAAKQVEALTAESVGNGLASLNSGEANMEKTETK